jgi:hypothetical protein
MKTALPVKVTLGRQWKGVLPENTDVPPALSFS